MVNFPQKCFVYKVTGNFIGSMVISWLENLKINIMRRFFNPLPFYPWSSQAKNCQLMIFLCNPDSIPDEEKKKPTKSPSKIFLHWGIKLLPTHLVTLTKKAQILIYCEIRQFGVRNDHSNHRFQAAAGLQRTPLSSWCGNNFAGHWFHPTNHRLSTKGMESSYLGK